MKVFSLLFFVFFMLSCNNTEKTVVIDNEVVNDSLKIAKDDISKIKYVEFAIDIKAKTSLDSWIAFNTVTNAITNLKQANFDFFKNDESIFTSTLAEIDTTIPEAVNTAPVRARILALKTKLYKLEEATNLATTKKEEQLAIVKEVFEAYSNMILQVNKKFEKEDQNIIKPELNEIN